MTNGPSGAPQTRNTSIGYCELIIDEGDKPAFMLEMRMTAHYGVLVHVEIWRYQEATERALVAWTERTRAHIKEHPHFVDRALELSFMILAPKEAFIDAPLDRLHRLEWTNPADIFWQWRVARGLPEHVVNRPCH